MVSRELCEQPLKYRVRYLHQPRGEIARYYPMTAPDALETARQLVVDGEREVMIESIETGEVWTPEQFKAVR